MKGRLLAAMQEASSAIATIHPTEGEVAPTGEDIVLGWFVAIQETFRAIYALLERDMHTEAFILGRTLLENSLRLNLVARADEPGRAVLALRYRRWAATEELKLRANEIELALPGSEEAGEEARRELASIDSSLVALGEEPSDFPNIFELVQLLGQTELYWWYRLTSHFAHSSLLGLSNRFTTSDDGSGIQIGAPNPDQVLRAGIFATELFVSGAVAAAIILGWEPETAIGIRNRAREEVRAMRLEGGLRDVYSEQDQDPRSDD